MAIGRAEWLNASKGFGFVMPEDGGKDVLVHAIVEQSAGLCGLAGAAKVSDEVAMERGRAAATNLRLA